MQWKLPDGDKDKEIAIANKAT